MRFLPLLLAALITGCAAIRPPSELAGPGEPENWRLKGRLAATIAGDGGSASFIWDKSANAFAEQSTNANGPGQAHTIEIYGPLGSGRVILSQSGGRASLDDGNTEQFGADIESVLYRRTGWLVPFSSLSDWMIGRPSPGPVQDRIYENGRLTGFTQSGWVVRYERFSNFSGRVVPARITLDATDEYLGRLSGNLGRAIDNARVKIVLGSADWG